MLFVCLLLCDSYRCSKLILIHKQAAIGSRARVFQYFTLCFTLIQCFQLSIALILDAISLVTALNALLLVISSNLLAA